MSKEYQEGVEYQSADFTLEPLKGEYEQCTFSKCVLPNSDLSEVRFVDCRFEQCDLSLAKLNKTAFRTIHFKDCKLLGLQFDHCSDFLLSVRFEGCQMNLSSFQTLKLKGTVFKDCTLHEVDFTEADLTAVTFDHCDLHRSIFLHTVLNACDFRTAFNYRLDPEVNRMSKAKFSLPEAVRLLDKYNLEIE